MVELAGHEALDFHTVNGSITLELGGLVNADLKAATVNGGIETDFPVTVRRAGFMGHRLRGTIGRGGPQLDLSTVNGSIRLRLLVDRTSIDIFGNDGSLYMPMGVIVPRDNLSLEVSAKGGDAKINLLEVHRLKSSWKR